MKKLLFLCSIVISSIWLCNVSIAEIEKSRAEAKIGNGIREIHAQVKNARIGVRKKIDVLKDYVQDHAGQFDATDITKLTTIRTKIVDWETESISLENDIDTAFPGLTK